MQIRLVAMLTFLLGVLSAQIEMNYSYEMKYGDGKQVTPLSQDTTDYDYFENILDIENL